MSLLLSAVARMLVLNRRVKRQDAGRAESIDSVPSYLQSITPDQPDEALPDATLDKPSKGCPDYPQPQPPSPSEIPAEDAQVSSCLSEEGDRKPGEKEVNDDNSDTNSSSDQNSHLSRLSAARVTAVNRALADGRTTQVVYFGLGDNVLLFLQSPVPPPVILYLVDDVADVCSTPVSAKPRSLEYPLLPDDVRVVRVRTDLQDDAWDAHVVQAGYDWHQRSSWVVNLDVNASHFSSIDILDTFLRMVHNLTTPLSTVILTYSTESYSESETDSEIEKSRSENVLEDKRVPLRFTPVSFSQFAHQRRFRVLSDHPIVIDKDCGALEEKENSQIGDSTQETVRIATLIQGVATSPTTTNPTSLDVTPESLDKSEDVTVEESSEEPWAMGQMKKPGEEPSESHSSDLGEPAMRDREEFTPASDVMNTPSASAFEYDSSETASKIEESVGERQDYDELNSKPDDEKKTANDGSVKERDESEVSSDVQLEETPQTKEASHSGTEVEETTESQTQADQQPELHDRSQAETQTPNQSQRATQSGALANMENQSNSNGVTVEFRLNLESLESNEIGDATDAIVIGSIGAMGEWQADGAVRMRGDLWNRESPLEAKVNVAQDVQSFEYKYALINRTGDIVKWENGGNRVVDATSIKVDGGASLVDHNSSRVVYRHEFWRH